MEPQQPTSSVSGEGIRVVGFGRGREQTLPAWMAKRSSADGDRQNPSAPDEENILFENSETTTRLPSSANEREQDQSSNKRLKVSGDETEPDDQHQSASTKEQTSEKDDASHASYSFRSNSSLPSKEGDPNDPDSADHSDGSVSLDQIVPQEASGNLQIDWITGSQAEVVLNSETCSCVVISGQGYLTCLEGSISIHGYAIHAIGEVIRGDKSRRLPFHFPPKLSSWMTVLLAPNISSARIRVESLELPDPCRHLAIGIFPQEKPQYPILSASFSIHSWSPESMVVRPTVIPHSWQATVKTLLQEYHSSAENQSGRPRPKVFSVAVCGAKGVGKSTFVRFLTHAFLSKINRKPIISILDADLGQPEFTPPGLVTLTRNISQPILSPPHMHMQHDSTNPLAQPNTCTQESYFLGSTSVARADAACSMASIEALVHQFHQNIDNGSSPQVLLVNLDGWVKGLGGELLEAILKQTLQPLDHAVQINGTTASQHFVLRGFQRTQTPQELNSNSMVIDTETIQCATKLHMVQSFKSNAESDTDVEERKATPRSISETINSTFATITAAEWRAMRFISYFLNNVSIWERIPVLASDLLLEIPQRLSAAVPYAVPLEAVTLLDPSDPGSQFDLSEWNARIVGLCHQKKEDSPDPLPPNLLPCLGLGLIRSIDTVKGILYILTPIPDPRPANVLVKSQGIDLPSEMAFRGAFSEAFPYAHFQRDDRNPHTGKQAIMGSKPVKSRNALARRKHHSHHHTGGN